ncbi:MAG: putative transcriptional regulator [Mycobacterium sp.]|nr:putative transcriptional regulator [Mycobacterium sp.]
MEFVRTAEQAGGRPSPGAGARPGPDERADREGGTRARVARLLLESGGRTASDLGTELGLSPAAVRRHLDAMAADGLITSRCDGSRGPRGRGRPAKTYVLTASGRDAVPETVAPRAYDDLATSALRFLAASGGEEAVGAFAAQRAAELESGYRQLLAGAPAATEGGSRAAQDVAVLAEALTAEGYVATSREVRTADGRLAGVQLCQHHCPVHHVAAEFPQLCEAETEAFARLLGRNVQRLATLAHGDAVCTTYLPVSAAPVPEPPPPADRAARPRGPASAAPTTSRPPTARERTP